MPKERLLKQSQAIPSKTQRERLAAPDRAQPLAPGAILQRAALAPQSLRPADILRLQQTLGNRAVAQMLSQSAENRTGLPDQLKAGIETLSGLSLDNVRVHRNSPRPAALDALAYAQGTDIHVGPGQERLLPHEAWHVVQQVQGRVGPTFQLNGEEINDDQGLEHEADVMGARSMRMRPHDDTAVRPFEQRDSNGEEFQLPANLSVGRIVHGSYPRGGVVVPKLGVAQLMEIPTKPKNYPDQRPHAKDSKGQSQWTNYENYDKFCSAVATYNKSHNTDARADELWKRAATVKDANDALKKVKPIKPIEPKQELKSEPKEYRIGALEPQVPDAVSIRPSAYNHAEDGWAGIMMGRGPNRVTNQDIKEYIKENLIARNFLSKTTPNQTRARTWPDNKIHNNGPNGSSMCTVAYEWRKDTNRWDVFHFGPNGEIASRNAIFDTFQ